MELIDKYKRIHHLAGIVPIGGQPMEFKMPWEDCLMPIGPDFLAVERAVYQCVLAGCNTIWVVGHMGTQPIVKKRVGNVIIDPLNENTFFGTFERRKYVTIYYVPIHPRDRSKRDCLGWSVLYGADSAYRISDFISKWIAPEKFFCSFPYGIVPDESLTANRIPLTSKGNNVFSYNGSTVKDNFHLPFTFDANDFFRCRDIVKHKQAEEWGDKSARFYDLKTVFKGLDIEHSNVIDLPWYHDLGTWEGYRAYIASEQSKTLRKQKKYFIQGSKKRINNVTDDDIQENKSE
jgi:hypothetical protein